MGDGGGGGRKKGGREKEVFGSISPTPEAWQNKNQTKRVVLFIYLIPICAPPLAAVKRSWAKLELAK